MLWYILSFMAVAVLVCLTVQTVLEERRLPVIMRNTSFDPLRFKMTKNRQGTPANFVIIDENCMMRPQFFDWAKDDLYLGDPTIRLDRGYPHQ